MRPEGLKDTGSLQHSAGPFPTSHKVMVERLARRAVFIGKRLAPTLPPVMVHLPVNVEQKLVYERSDCRVSHFAPEILAWPNGSRRPQPVAPASLCLKVLPVR